MNLILLPFAGGTSAAYNFLKSDIDPEIDFIVPELAGRAIRYNDEMYHSISEAVEDIFTYIRSKLCGRYILFGHSMGAVLVYELYCKIVKSKMDIPEAIIISGIAPNRTCFKKDILLLPKEDFIQNVSKLGGIPKEIANNQEIIDYITPFLRNDIKIIYEHKITSIEKIKCDVYILNGEKDLFNISEVMLWEKYCDKKPFYHTFSGGHFFIYDHHKEIAELINSINKSKGEHMEKILAIINNYAESPVYENSINDICMRDLGINSVNYIKIIVDLESEFDIEFDDDMLIDKNSSIGDFILNVLKLI